MRLERWIRRNNLCSSEFAKISGIPRSTLQKYLFEGAIPGIEAMKKIYNATHGAVSANDFYGLSEKTFFGDEESRESNPRYD